MFTTFSLAIILDCTVRIVLGTALGALIGARTPVARPKCSACAGMWSTSPRPTDADQQHRNSTTNQQVGWGIEPHPTLLLSGDCQTHSRHGERGALQVLTARGWPMSSSNSPGSTMRLASGSTIVQFATGISKATVLVSPGSSATRWNAFNSRSVQL